MVEYNHVLNVFSHESEMVVIVYNMVILADEKLQNISEDMSCSGVWNWNMYVVYIHTVYYNIISCNYYDNMIIECQSEVSLV